MNRQDRDRGTGVEPYKKRIMKKLEIKTEMLRRNSPVIKPWGQS